MPAFAATEFDSNFDAVAVAGSYQVYPTASVIDGWTVGGTVDVINGQHGAIDLKSVDLAGTPGPGFIERSFNQVAGTTYTLKWDYFNNLDNGLGDAGSVTFGGATSGFGPANAIFRNATLSFTALTTGLSMVRFASTGTSSGQYVNSFGATVDNISVTSVVPEPAGYVLACASLLLLGAALRRKRR